MSWCLNDVVEINGPIGVQDDRDASAWHGEGEVIYPDLNPRGLKPGDFSPEDVLPEDLPLSPPVEEMPEAAAPENAIRVLPHD